MTPTNLYSDKEIVVKSLRYVWTAVATAAVLVIGCSQPGQQPAEEPQPSSSAYLLTEEPEGAHEVVDVLESAADGDEIVLVGRIGGDVNPWVEDVAAFNVADNSLVPCNEREGDTCETPWDYCCEADLGKATTLVEVVDGDGKLVATGARELLGVQELDTVVVQGTAQRDADGNLTVLATGVYVRP